MTSADATLIVPSPARTPQTTSEDAAAFTQGLRLQTLVRLRWLAVGGQTASVCLVHFGLGFPLPLAWCLLLIALSAWLNMFLTLRWRSSLRLKDRHAALLLAYDIVQLAALLYLTGGLGNPFVFLFLVPVTISASMLAVKRTLWLIAIALSAITLLGFFHLPLPWYPGEAYKLSPVYLVGMWTALTSGIVFAAIYASRIARESRLMSRALSAAEAVLAREQQLNALDGLAAAAAHELGTPLATISLVAKELKRELPEEGPLGEDLDLLVSQSDRCREILSRLTRRDSQSDEVYARIKLQVMLEEIIEPLRAPDITITVEARGNDDEPVLARNPAVKYGLGNLMENAVDFANDKVTVEAVWDTREVAVTITDDGPGFAQDVIDRLGDPYVTTRQGYGKDGPVESETAHHGMGLGFFIAKTLLERSGAWVTLANRPQPSRGAVVRIAWPRKVIANEEAAA